MRTPVWHKRTCERCQVTFDSLDPESTDCESCNIAPCEGRPAVLVTLASVASSAANRGGEMSEEVVNIWTDDDGGVWLEIDGVTFGPYDTERQAEENAMDIFALKPSDESA